MSSHQNHEEEWSVQKVRDTFINYFKDECEHDFVVSSPVVPHDDPTLLFINAGMNQFKSIFVGTVDPNSAFGKLKRACNTQKCIRAGGKHNDLEDVGKDSYHHTFFEMLGNWSFGDYFKKDAITWAYHLLTKVYKLDPNRMYVSYFGGDPKIPDCQPDLEARDLWLNFLPADRVLPFSAKENFWEMGETGPCGPCSEIHYDRIGGRHVAHLVNADDPNVVEIWNLVFMQYNREADKSLSKLPFGSVDTGMGLERLASIMINKPSNYDISTFQHIFKCIQNVIPALADKPYGGRYFADDKDGVDMAYRVIADHIRTLSVAIADGAVPSNDGRGYVLRRILRRAIRFGKQKLGAPNQPWFCKLVQSVVDILGDVFPTLKTHQKFIEEVIASEEKQFTSTLERGLREFDRVLEVVRKENGTVFPGGEPGAFTLFTTYGFPLDLTQLMAEEHGLKVDMVAYEAHFEEHRRKAREGGKKTVGEELKLNQEALYELGVTSAIPGTVDEFKYTWNSGQGTGSALQSKIVAIYDGKNFVKEFTVVNGEQKKLGLVLDKTNFYAEAGGQIADLGAICGFSEDDDMVSDVEDVQKFANYVLHTVIVKGGVVKVGQQVACSPDFARRALTAKNHTATHILNFALRKTLSDTADQRGSLVDPQKLRFDFAYNGVPPVEALAEAESIICNLVKESRKINAIVLPLEEAKKIPGLRFMAGEQYPDPVRVISMAKDLFNDNDGGVENSVEFCGGTHLSNTSEIESFSLISEEGVAKGIRRLVGYTGEASIKAIAEGKAFSKRIDRLADVSGAELDAQLATLRGQLEAHTELPYVVKKQCLERVEEIKKKQLELAKLRMKAILDSAKSVATSFISQVNDKNVFYVFEAHQLEGDSKAVDTCSKAIEAELPQLSFTIISAVPNGSCFVSVVNQKGDAKPILDQILNACGGKGGGKGNRVVGSAKSTSQQQIQDAINVAKNIKI